MHFTASSLEIRSLPVSEFEQAVSLHRGHWQEVAEHRDVMVLAPDWLRYMALEQKGLLLSLGAYVDGVLVGYSVGVVAPHMHYRDLLYYQNDVLYVSPSHRRGRLGMRLILETEQEAKSM